jgi:outer membrane protein assembly factor BamE (lipoprotein component of BamABCDE complex)
MMRHVPLQDCLQPVTTNKTQDRTMKKTLIIISLLVSATLLGVSGCASDKGQQTAGTSQPKPAKPAKPPKDKRPKEDRLSVGMTMDQVVQAIGKPRGKAANSDGSEIWTYNDMEKAMFIPYYSMSGGKTHNLMVIFDTNGKVKSWSSSSQSAY